MPRRIQMSRQRPWRNADTADVVIVDRRSPWGNPYVITTVDCELGGTCREVRYRGAAIAQHLDVATAQARAVELFDRIVRSDSPHWTAYRQRVRDELRGKSLACWCRPDDPCHADVLLDIANGGV